MTARDFEELDALRWASAVTAQARGEALEPEEREFKAAIEAGNPELEEELDFWRAVAHEGESGLAGEMSDDDLAASVLAAFADPVASTGPLDLEALSRAAEHNELEPEALEDAPAPREQGRPAPVLALAARRRARYGMAAGIGLGLAAAAAVVIGVLGGVPNVPGWDPTVPGAAPQAASLDGELSEPGVRRRAGAIIPAEEDCVPIGPSSRACIEEGALEVVAAVDGGEPRIRVDQGSLRVVSDDVAVDGGEVVASVVETPIATLHGHGASYEASVAEQPLLLILVVDRGEVEVEHKDGSRRQVRAGERVTIQLADGAAEADADLADAELAVDGEGEPSVADARRARAALLSTAQAHVEEGDRGRAIKAYRKLVDDHAGSSEARLARVSLGRLYLEDGQGSKALVQFRKYLKRSGGQLREEALYGEIRALRSLGRKAAEQEAIERFLDAHPRSIYAAGLRRRLDDGATGEGSSPAPAAG